MHTPAYIRTIEYGELRALLDLYQYLHPVDAPLPAEPDLDRLWKSIMADPHLHYIVAVVNGTLVASCTLTVIPNLTRGARPYGVIENVVTHLAYRRRGLGNAVLPRALSIAWQTACYKVMLLTGRAEAHEF